MAEVSKRTVEQRAKVAAEIVAAMKDEGIDWVIPWSRLEAPRNGSTDRVYQGGRNRAHLLAAMRAEDTVDPRFFTYNQANKAGYKVKKGASSCIIEHWSRVIVPSPDDATDEYDHPVFISVPHFNKHWSVFPASMIEGLEPYTPPRYVEPTDPRIWDIADRLIASSRCEVREGADHQAGWAPEPDKIFIADRRMFPGEQGAGHFVRTLAHEMAHSTSKVLGRDVTTDQTDPRYWFEELVAELASAFVAADLGFALGEADEKFVEQHAAYLSFWASKLDDTPDAFFRAATLAEKAADFIVDRYNDATIAPKTPVVKVAEEDEAPTAHEAPATPTKTVETAEPVDEKVPAKPAKPAKSARGKHMKVAAAVA